MTKKSDLARIETGVRNLDALLSGGVPNGAVIVLSGPPGAGKTILTQQICFHHASAEQRVLYFSTLSEPTAKTLRYLSRFTFFDAKKLDVAIQFIDLGVILGMKGLEEASSAIMEHVKRVKPTMVVIDSFKVFDDLAKSAVDLRKFGYELAVNLMAWEVTTFLLGEYGPDDLATNPLFSIVDGLVLVTQREQSGEQQRFLQVLKMRGTDHSRDEHAFVINSNGAEVFAPRVTIVREDSPETDRCRTGISKLDALLGEGIPRGSSLLIAGVAGTGKTVLGLEFLYRGAEQNEKGIIFSFEETQERLRAAARGLGWDLDRQIELGMVKIIFIPQPNILVEGDLLMMRERIEAFGARRVVVDSVSVFLHKIKDPQIDREKIFQLGTIIQNTQAVGFFATDIPYGANQLSRFGVEETVVDGVILLSSTEEGLNRRRYLEVYKLRNTAHLKGRHPMVIGQGGVEIFPRYDDEAELVAPPPALDVSRRLSSGVPGLDELIGGGLLDRSITVVSGSPGIGKTTLGIQFILEGAKQQEPGLYVALDESPAQLEKSATALGLPLEPATKAGLVEILYLSREHVRAHQLLSILADKIRTLKIRRLVIDNAGHVMTDGLQPLLDALVKRFKALGVTSMLSLEAASMHSTDTITDQGLSGIADNIIMLRYAPPPGELLPLLTVVKTRGSAHDRRTHDFRIDQGGLEIVEPTGRGRP